MIDKTPGTVPFRGLFDALTSTRRALMSDTDFFEGRFYDKIVPG